MPFGMATSWRRKRSTRPAVSAWAHSGGARSTGYVLENARVAPSEPTADFKANLHEKKAYVGLQIYVRLEVHLLNSNYVKRIK